MKTRKKIIAFMNSYSHGKSGGDMVFIEVAKRLNDFEKVVVTSFLGQKLCEETGLKGTYFVTSHETEFKHVVVIYIRRTIKAFLLQLDIHDKDILLGTSDFFPDILPIFFLKLKHKKNKWVQHIFHIIPKDRKLPHLLQKISLFLIKNAADRVITDNSLLKKELINMGFASKKVTVNYPGIDRTLLKSVKVHPKKQYDAIFMAQLRPSKGIDDLLKIWELVCGHLPNASLAVIGKGEIKSENNIDFLGFLEDNEAFSLIKSSTVFLFPSHEEGFGIAALQSQALGVPVVAWDLPVFSEIFPKGMITVKRFDLEKFSRIVITLLENKTLRQKISREAIDNARRFDWDKTAEKERELL